MPLNQQICAAITIEAMKDAKNEFGGHGHGGAITTERGNQVSSQCGMIIDDGNWAETAIIATKKLHLDAAEMAAAKAAAAVLPSRRFATLYEGVNL